MNLLKTGQKLGLFFQKEENLVEIDCTLSAVHDDRIVVELPQYFMRYIDFLDVGSSLTVKVFSKIGTLDFNSVVISSPLEEDFILELDYNAMKITEADDMPIVKPVETISLTTGEVTKYAKTFEISTSYLKIYSDMSYKVGDSFDCTLILPKQFGNIKFTGSITKVDPVYDNEFTITYDTMTEKARQNLLYYMYVYNNSTN